jgi:hypothetical protein
VIRVPSGGRSKTKLKRAGSGLCSSDYTKRRARRKLDKLIIKNVSRITAATTAPVVDENEAELVCSSILQQLIDSVRDERPSFSSDMLCLWEDSELARLQEEERIAHLATLDRQIEHDKQQEYKSE